MSMTNIEMEALTLVKSACSAYLQSQREQSREMDIVELAKQIYIHNNIPVSECISCAETFYREVDEWKKEHK